MLLSKDEPRLKCNNLHMFVAFPGFPYSTRPQCRMLSQTFGNAEKFPGHFGCEATKEDEHLGTTEANLCSFDIWGCRFSGPPSSDNWGPWLFAVCKGRNFAQLYIGIYRDYSKPF